MLRGVRFCLMMEGQEGVGWEAWLSAARAAERLGFEALFTSDHYLSVMRHRDHDRGSSDAWTNLGALAASTTTIRLGTLVSPVTFRLPAVLAKAAITVDRVSGERVELGMGAGWWEDEHRTHGFPFPDAPTRFDMLEEQLEIVHALMTKERFSFQGQHYQLDDVPFAPKGSRIRIPPSSWAATVGPGLPRSSRAGPTSSTPSGPLPSRPASDSGAFVNGSTPTAGPRTRSRRRS